MSSRSVSPERCAIVSSKGVLQECHLSVWTQGVSQVSLLEIWQISIVSACQHTCRHSGSWASSCFVSPRNTLRWQVFSAEAARIQDKEGWCDHQQNTCRLDLFFDSLGWKVRLHEVSCLHFFWRNFHLFLALQKMLDDVGCILTKNNVCYHYNPEQHTLTSLDGIKSCHWYFPSRTSTGIGCRPGQQEPTCNSNA